MPIKTGKVAEHNRTEVMVLGNTAVSSVQWKGDNQCLLIDAVCLFDSKVVFYDSLKYEILRIWKMKTVEIF